MMSYQDNAANQRSINVQCKCGWKGRAPEELTVNMANQQLLCPQCYAPFNAWPIDNRSQITTNSAGS